MQYLCNTICNNVRNNDVITYANQGSNFTLQTIKGGQGNDVVTFEFDEVKNSKDNPQFY